MPLRDQLAIGFTLEEKPTSSKDTITESCLKYFLKLLINK